jgi:hypothetical protein
MYKTASQIADSVLHQWSQECEKCAGIVGAVKGFIPKARAALSGAGKGIANSYAENPGAWHSTGAALATTGALGVGAYGMSQAAKRKKQLNAGQPAGGQLPVAGTYAKAAAAGQVRLDSGAGRQQAILRQKYKSQNYSDADADMYAQGAAQKLWQEHGRSGGVPAYHKAVGSFQAPAQGTWVSPEETQKHLKNPALQAALLKMTSGR